MEKLIRTVKAHSLPLNAHKWQRLEAVVRAYAREKADHLSVFNHDAIFASVDQHEDSRDALVDIQYASSHHLQARMWKSALKDAYETVLKNWAKLSEELRGKVGQHPSWNKAQKHYANWLLYKEHRLAALVSGKAPLAPHTKATYPERKPVQSYLRREVRRHRGKRPQVRIARSFALDAQMYSTFEQKGRQYISVMTLDKGKRVIIPLTGKQVIEGNIRVVLDREHHTVAVHYTAAVDIPKALEGDPIGLDVGLSEVFTDDAGTHYGTEFEQTLLTQSDALCDKGRKRNKLHQLEKKHRAKGNFKKANRIRKFNLGTQKQERQQRKAQAEVARQVNTAINQVITERQPAEIASEKLNLRGKAQNKQLSRRVSSWARGTIDERLEFKASARSSCRKHVNPAYTSQTCPQCGFLHSKNRKGDGFQCRHCGHKDDADRVAAENLKARMSDPDISVYTPKERVKAILLERFIARSRRGGDAELLRARL